MAFSIVSRVVQTTTSIGTGSLTLIAPAAGARSFVAGYGDGNSTEFVIVDPASGDWELTIGAVTAGSPDSISRAPTPIASSNAGAKVNFAAGTKIVFSCHTAELTPYFAAVPSYADGQIMQRKDSAWVVRTLEQFFDDLTDTGVLADVATSGAYADLTGTPTLSAVATSGAYSDLSGRPLLADVAISGDASDLSGLGSAASVNTGTSGATIPLLNGANTFSGKQTLSAGADVTPASTPTTSAVGYLGAPQDLHNASYTLVMGDAGKMIYHTSATGHAWTIPPNSSVAFPIGTMIVLVNDGSGNVTITRGSGVTLRLAGVATSANRTLAQYGVATLIKVDTNTWYVSGVVT